MLDLFNALGNIVNLITMGLFAAATVHHISKKMGMDRDKERLLKILPITLDEISSGEQIKVKASIVQQVDGKGKIPTLRNYTHSLEIEAISLITDKIKILYQKKLILQFIDFVRSLLEKKENNTNYSLLDFSDLVNDHLETNLMQFGNNTYNGRLFDKEISLFFVDGDGNHGSVYFNGMNFFCYEKECSENKYKNYTDSKKCYAVTKDIGIILRVKNNTKTGLIFAGKHMYGTFAASLVAFDENFQNKISNKGFKYFAQLVTVEVIDGIVDERSINWDREDYLLELSYGSDNLLDNNIIKKYTSYHTSIIVPAYIRNSADIDLLTETLKQLASAKVKIFVGLQLENDNCVSQLYRFTQDKNAQITYYMLSNVKGKWEAISEVKKRIEEENFSQVIITDADYPFSDESYKSLLSVNIQNNEIYIAERDAINLDSVDKISEYDRMFLEVIVNTAIMIKVKYTNRYQALDIQSGTYIMTWSSFKDFDLTEIKGYGGETYLFEMFVRQNSIIKPLQVKVNTQKTSQSNYKVQEIIEKYSELFSFIEDKNELLVLSLDIYKNYLLNLETQYRDWIKEHLYF